MDDVWDTKAWDDIRRFFPDDNNGSRIILTTRQSEVAIYANSNSPHNMSLLSPNASWELLTKTVFGQEECPLGLEKIGREIAQNCKGLPLAIVVIGGLLSKESKEKDWEQIAEDVNSAVARNVGDQFMEILSLSYDSLPHHLRACFLYIAVFPEDHEIIVSQLIKLWIAEGFIKPPTPKSFEEVAEGYLKDLIGRSLIQTGTFALFPKVETLNVDHSTSHIVSCRLLNILDALTVMFHGFPRGIFELVHLRYLAFTYSGERKFPASIYKLQNLQTLIIHQMIVSPHYILHLPSSIWKMPKLRHLLVKRSFLPHPVPTDSAIMENLQTLSQVTNFKCSKEVLMFIPNVKKLGISYYYDSSTDWSSYEFHNFVYLHHLQTLKCLFIATDFLCSRPLPVNLAFPQSLKELTLSGFQFSQENMTVVGSLHNLEVLKLKDCAFEGSVWEPKEGEFTRLSFLLIELTSLEHWRANSTHFPQLRHLRLRYCFMLATIPSEIGDIQALELLELHECTPSACQQC
ncbi:UNVERIFIED_CONTAM: putative late blight resistance proteinR1A-10 [Sesamum radiatum]|uniref:Late blight resistance proteinR1A-10 n=1 Tax=Sesamum radiatum TaxID=300843 RepID=A0AAW2S088_SESRA